MSILSWKDPIFLSEFDFSSSWLSLSWRILKEKPQLTNPKTIEKEKIGLSGVEGFYGINYKSAMNVANFFCSKNNIEKLY